MQEDSSCAITKKETTQDSLHLHRTGQFINTASRLSKLCKRAFPVIPLWFYLLVTLQCSQTLVGVMFRVNVCICFDVRLCRVAFASHLTVCQAHEYMLPVSDPVFCALGQWLSCPSDLIQALRSQVRDLGPGGQQGDVV